MHNYRNYFWICVVLSASLVSCVTTDDSDPELAEGVERQHVPLKELFKDHFFIGAAITPEHTDARTPHGSTLLEHFNSVTAENVMKPDAIQRVKGAYTWTNADRIVDFALENNLKVRGHTLTWHSQTPDWFFYDEHGDLLSKEVALDQLEEHITTVMTRYKGRIDSWDVVNEALYDWDPNGQIIYREDSPWYQIMGESYIDSAFVYARRADPDAKLFYNDYNAIFSWKRDKIYNLVKRLKDNNIPIDGVGLQGHWSVGTSIQDLRTTLELFKGLGVEVQITELDLSVYLSNNEPGSEIYTDAFNLRQRVAYREIFSVLLDYSDMITGVTFWGIGDDASWLDRPGRKHFPFLLNEQLEPKDAYRDVQQLLE
ncbi:endo-1,4-beta-xylanase [Lunatimonas salinarum]|uniref:endo-1,4-beta-xylanase n=1 Tax=Lunatimonas salinarum TaxID=1774590 RepID=UPI001AE02CE5|nr:endo-1,4-beta-xylanase [Lunatimonas salinarum]